VLGEIGEDFHGPLGFLLHGLTSPAVWIAFAGVLAAWYLYLKNPLLPERIRARFNGLYELLSNKYYFDYFNERFLAGGSLQAGRLLWRVGDVALIDGLLVNGTANSVGRVAGVWRRLQTGYLYHYAFAMVIGLVVLIGWLIW
jgi:NADH-quinone oxidoreductase subunit L